MAAMFDGTARQITLAVMDTATRETFLINEAKNTIELLKHTTDPSKIAEFDKLINTDLTQAFGLLSPEEQKKQQGEFLKNVSLANSITETQLTASGNAITQTLDGNTSVLGVIRDALSNAADKQTEAANKLIAAADKISAAAEKQDSAADKNLISANTPVKVDTIEIAPIQIVLSPQMQGNGP